MEIRFIQKHRINPQWKAETSAKLMGDGVIHLSKKKTSILNSGTHSINYLLND